MPVGWQPSPGGYGLLIMGLEWAKSLEIHKKHGVYTLFLQSDFTNSNAAIKGFTFFAQSRLFVAVNQCC